MKIKFIVDFEVEVLGKDKLLSVSKDQIFEVDEVESHDKDDDTVDIHLKTGDILMYVPVISFNEYH